MTTKIKTPGITDANVTTVKLDLISTSSTPGATVKGDGTTDGYLQLNCSQNSHGIKLKSPPHSAAQSYTLTFPQSITDGYFLKTDGSGNLSFAQVNDAATAPTISSFTPTTAEGGVNTSIVITGTNYVSTPRVEFQSNTDGSIQHAATVQFDSATQLTVGTGTGLVNGTNYFIIITNPNGQSVRSTSQLSTSAAPVWTTSAGSLGTVAGNFSGTVATVAATGDTIAYSEVTNVLTNASLANCALNSSTGVITTTDFGGAATTAQTYTFTLRATDAQAQTTDREFTLTSSYGLSNGMQFN
tara:strand:- start:5342 stop:6238 length:897 start_codon:yes stop_codon:yes gene_type:complete